MPRLDRLLAAENELAAPAKTCADDIAFWLYSSGTTGMPKGVMHVHSSPKVMAKNAGQRRIGYREDDLVFSAAKLFFAYGISNAMFCPMWVGATSVFYPERPTSQTVFEVLKGYQPTLFFGVPTLYAAILADPDCTPRNSSQRLRLCFSAGEALPAHIGRTWKERFDLDIVNGVGSSEMGHLFLTNLPDAVEYGTSGVAVDGYKLRLIDENENDVGDGEIGELWVNGDFGRRWLLEPARKIAPNLHRRVDTDRPTNTCVVPTASIPSAVAPTTCSRSAASGCRPSRSRRP